MTAAMTICVGAATSQTTPQPVTVDNQQVQLGDVFSQQTLNVEDSSGQTTAATTATGNSVSAAAQGVPMSFTSSQSMQGSASASTTVNANGSAGHGVVIVTEAAGNTGQASVSGATLSGSVSQATNGSAISASTGLYAPLGSAAGTVSVSTSAIGNTQAWGTDSGSAGHATRQTNSSALNAVTDVDVQYMPGTAGFSANAIANSVSADGSAASQAGVISQTNTATRVQAGAFVATGNATDATGAATTVGNNATLTNAAGVLNVVIDQSNSSYVRSDSSVGAYEYGATTSSAYATGNSSLAGENGPSLTFDNTQMTSGGVEAVAHANGTNGFDASVSAVATGNAATGYACSLCEATFSAANRQTNNDGVSATATVDVAGSSRNTTATSAATGNSATFFVTRPR